MTQPEQSLRDRGTAAFREGRSEEAIRLLREAVAADPRDHRAYSVLGAAYLQRREFDQAVSAFEAARHIRPDAANIHYNLGLAYQRAGKPEQSLAAFQAAIEVDPSYDKAKQALDRARMTEAQRAAQPQPAPAEERAETAAPAQAPPPAPGQRRMPTAPPAQQQQPGVPWQASAPGTSRQADVGLRRLGGEPAAQAGGQAEAPRAPWQNGSEEATFAPRPPVGGPAGEEEAAKKKRKGASEADYLRLGFNVGARYGFFFVVLVALFDRYVQAHYGLTAKLPAISLLPLVIGAGVFGIIYGGVVGMVTAHFKQANAGLAASIGGWALLSMIIILPAAGQLDATTFLLGAVMGVGYGLIMGWLISNNVMTYVKRL